MYDNENNSNNNNNFNGSEYHYNYRPDYTEPWNVSPQPTRDTPRKKHTARRAIAIVLCAVLLVSIAFGAGWAVKGSGIADKKSQTELMLSERERPEVKTVSVTGSQKLSFPEIYSANVNGCVSINVSSVGYNFFGQQVKNASSGSGFVITKDGYIVTNYHVISGGTSVEVTLYNGKTYSGQVVGGDADYDLAVLKIDPGEEELQCVVLGTSDSLQVGDEVVAIGNPLGELTFSMSEGIVSCLDREINLDGTPFNMIQTTAAVNHGNSGGPLFNIYGEVIGIVAAKSEDSQYTVEGLGFAIPIDDVLSLIKDIMENGQVTNHAYMGIKGGDASRYPECGVDAGVYVAEVTEGGPAEKSGLAVGDVITMIGSTIISDWEDLSSVMGSKTYKAGDTATITYIRDGQVATAELTFGSTTEMPQDDTTTAQPDSRQQDGGAPYSSGDMEDFFNYFFGGRMG